MESSIQTQKYGFNENFAPKNIGFLHISYPKIWVTVFMERWVSISNFQLTVSCATWDNTDLSVNFLVSESNSQRFCVVLI